MVSDYLEVVISFVLFLLMLIFFYDFIFHKSEIRTVLLEVGIDLGLLKKALLKTSKIVLMYSNSLARQFSSMFHAKCLLPRLDKLLPLRSCLQNFYQCTYCITSLHTNLAVWHPITNPRFEISRNKPKKFSSKPTIHDHFMVNNVLIKERTKWRN